MASCLSYEFSILYFHVQTFLQQKDFRANFQLYIPHINRTLFHVWLLYEKRNVLWRWTVSSQLFDFDFVQTFILFTEVNLFKRNKHSCNFERDVVMNISFSCYFWLVLSKSYFFTSNVISKWYYDKISID